MNVVCAFCLLAEPGDGSLALIDAPPMQFSSSVIITKESGQIFKGHDFEIQLVG